MIPNYENCERLLCSSQILNPQSMRLKNITRRDRKIFVYFNAKLFNISATVILVVDLLGNPIHQCHFCSFLGILMVSGVLRFIYFFLGPLNIKRV